jgi:Glycosyltransferase family 10 (fucosyltransferase) C-term
MIINLFDAAFAHNLGGGGSSVHGKTAKHVQYVRHKMRWDGVTLLTDDMLCQSRALEILESKVTIGWLLECREYRPTNYLIAESVLPELDMLLTHDAELLEKYPNKVRFVPFGGSWVSRIGLRPKSRHVSMIYSAKAFLPGHRLRQQVAKRALFPVATATDGASDSSRLAIDLFGRGSAKPIERKEEGLDDYRFSIAIENSRASNYFTEKLLDCFATGTVPIYWGCPNLSTWFNMDGVITFDTAADIPLILEGCEYSRHLKAAKENLERMREFEITDDYIYQHVLKEFE